ncbi:MAG: glycosyltransferase family 2 protein [Candidatus Korobacteraceae bacterium]
MVSITIVTWNSERYLSECFASLRQQDYPELEVTIVDNASTDGTRALLRNVASSWRVIYNDSNVGFAVGQNQAIRASTGEWALCLNPDVILSPDFITQVVKAGEAHPEAGSLCGKLLRLNPGSPSLFQGTTSVVQNGLLKGEGFSPCAEPAQGLKPTSSTANAARLKPCPDTKPTSDTDRSVGAHAGQIHSSPMQTRFANFRRTNIIDSTGIYFTRNMRHLDRGAEETDHGQYDRVQYVFGASGAAAMFRRDFIEALTVEAQFFDEEFFAFREDGDLAWRAQLMGWKCLYTPAAVAWHVRRVTPERRADLPLVINWHSVKNRFLMRGKNASGWLCWRLFFPVAWRDLMTLGYALLRDWRMISAVVYPFRAFGSIRRKRAIVQSRRKVSDRDLLWWFCNRPRAVDVKSSRQ